MRIALAMVSLLLSGVVAAETCETLAAKYVDLDKEISHEKVVSLMADLNGGMRDRSMQNMTRDLAINNALLRKQIIQQQLVLKNCKLPDVVEANYGMAAVACYRSQRADSAECDRSKWNPNVK